IAESQRGNDHLFTMEFHEIEPATSSGILVLSPTFDSYVVTFNLVGQSGHATGCNRQSKQLAKQADQRHGECRGTAQARAWRRMGMDEKIEAIRAQLVEFEALQHPFDQIHLTIENEVFLLSEVNYRPVIKRAKANRTFRLGH